METTPTLREKDSSGGEEWHEEDKRKSKNCILPSFWNPGS
jgi:hypothetical protein